jgi:AraC family transcriptional regulator, regulatory protein of adaptative response / methylated-DNA-[protein]-cysteine methyltransferase
MSTVCTTMSKIENDPRWQAVANRDSASDGKFFYSVATTGIFCRPSCPARLAKPENVQFHDTCEQARNAGYRPCKRCKPEQGSLTQQHAEKIVSVCRLLDNNDTAPKLNDLAEHAGLSPYHFHRLFKQVTGVTPKEYAASRRTNKLHSELAEADSVTEAIFEAGFNSSSRFYEQSTGLLGMTPTEFRSGGERTTIQFAVGECSLGSILVACTARGACAILMGDDPQLLIQDLQKRFPSANLCVPDREFEQYVALVVGLVEQPERGHSLPLDIRGTAFQRRVWQALRQIPAGTTMTYTEIAEKIGAPNAVRAVAGACAANPLAVAIPCHRVIRTDGGLSGYRWGIERKKELLKREGNRPEKS